jgi:hypothetical protein
MRGQSNVRSDKISVSFFCNINVGKIYMEQKKNFVKRNYCNDVWNIKKNILTKVCEIITLNDRLGPNLGTPTLSFSEGMWWLSQGNVAAV